MLLIKLIISGSLFLFSGFTLKAQDTILNRLQENAGDDFISWVSQYPYLKADNKAKPKERFTNFIFGNKQNSELIQPVAVMARNLHDYFILDQESGNIFRVQNELGQITHFRDKTFKNFISLVGICRLPSEIVLFTDSYYNKIFFYIPGKKELGVLNDSLTFDRPTGLAYSPVNQEIWVVETNAHRVTIGGCLHLCLGESVVNDHWVQELMS